MNKTDASARIDLKGRLAFMQVDANNLEEIRQVKSVVERELPVALDKFYDQVRSTPQVARFFSNDGHIVKAKGAQIGHWGAISTAKFDDRFAENVRRIGLTHARIGLEPRWYIGGYALIIEHLIKSILVDISPDKNAAERFGKILASFTKAVLLDMDLAISVYIDAAEEARLAAEAEATARERELVSKSIGTALSYLAAKDLTYRMAFDLPEAYRGLQADFNAAIDDLEQAVRNVGDATRAIAGGTQEIAAASDNLAQRTEQQAACLEESSAAVNELSKALNSAAQSSTKTKDIISAARRDAEKSSEVVRQTTTAMEGIRGSSHQISDIIGVIDDIALQTNMLALNAGVEAARAGDAGRGFAVVAAEVRALAKRSAEAAKQIKGLVTRSTSEVDAGAKLVSATGGAIERIMSQVSVIDGGIGSIAGMALDQAQTLKQVNTAICEIDQSTQQNAAMAEEASAACQSLAQETEALATMIGEFRVGGGVHEPQSRQSIASTTRTNSHEIPRTVVKGVFPRR